MAMLTKVVHKLCSDESAAANYHDLHVLNHMRLLNRGPNVSERLHCWPHDELVDINIGRLLDGECDGSCNGIGFDCGICDRFERLSRAGIGNMGEQFTLDRARADNGAANIRPSLLPKAFRDRRERRISCRSKPHRQETQHDRPLMIC